MIHVVKCLFFSDDLMEDILNVDLLRQTEGTAILHVSFAAMEQRELGQEFLKYLKVHLHVQLLFTTLISRVSDQKGVSLQ